MDTENENKSVLNWLTNTDALENQLHGSFDCLFEQTLENDFAGDISPYLEYFQASKRIISCKCFRNKLCYGKIGDYLATELCISSSCSCLLR